MKNYVTSSKPNKLVPGPDMVLYFACMVCDPGSNNKKLFAYIKDIKCDSSGVAPMKKYDINYSEPTDQVEILNAQFVSAFTKEDCISIVKQHSKFCAISQHPGKWSEEATS